MKRSPVSSTASRRGWPPRRGEGRAPRVRCDGTADSGGGRTRLAPARYRRVFKPIHAGELTSRGLPPRQVRG
jgi:hypothetical protein